MCGPRKEIKARAEDAQLTRGLHVSHPCRLSLPGSTITLSPWARGYIALCPLPHQQTPPLPQPPQRSRKGELDEGIRENTPTSGGRHSQRRQRRCRYGAASRPRPATHAAKSPFFSGSRSGHLPLSRRLVSVPKSCRAADTHHVGGWRRILKYRGEQGSAPTMAAAAAEETADVNARPFIGRRRLGTSRDGAGAPPAWLAGTQLWTGVHMRRALPFGLNT